MFILACPRGTVQCALPIWLPCQAPGSTEFNCGCWRLVGVHRSTKCIFRE